jgi:hypothetical protein
MIKKLMPLMVVLALGACTTASAVPADTTARPPCCHECHKCKCEHCKKNHCNCAHKDARVKKGEMCDMPPPAALNN